MQDSIKNNQDISPSPNNTKDSNNLQNEINNIDSIESNLSPAHHPFNKKDSNIQTPHTNATYKDFAGIKHKLKDYNTLSDDEKKEGYIFHIFTNEISKQTQEKLANFQTELSKIYPSEIKIHNVDETPFRNGIKWAGNYMAYYRLKIPQMLENVKTALYLDCDMLVLCDIRELFSINLESKFAGIIIDAATATRRHTIKARNTAHNDITFDVNYFNSGFLLLNLDSINPNKFWEDSINLINDYELNFPDQDVLNEMFKDNILKLSLAYNFMVPYFLSLPVEFCNDECEIFDINYTRKQYAIAEKNVKIYHYTFPKPWKSMQEQAWIWDIHGVDAKAHRVNILEKMWWRNALATPIFSAELALLKESLDNDKMDYATFIKYKMMNLENTLKKEMNGLESYHRKKLRKRDRIYISLISALFITIIASFAFRI